MNLKKYGWRFPIPRFKCHWKDILIFNTYISILAMWPWLIDGMFINPVQGMPQVFMLLLTIPCAVFVTSYYALLTAWVSRKVSIKIKLIVTIFVFSLSQIFSIPYLSFDLIEKGGLYSYLGSALMTSSAFVFGVLSFITFFMGMGAIIVLPLLGLYRKQ